MSTNRIPIDKIYKKYAKKGVFRLKNFYKKVAFSINVCYNLIECGNAELIFVSVQKQFCLKFHSGGMT